MQTHPHTHRGQREIIVTACLQHGEKEFSQRFFDMGQGSCNSTCSEFEAEEK